MFVLISMQKLASSSVAAIKHALRKRVNRYKEAEIRTLHKPLPVKINGTSKFPEVQL
jgi:hypothetical protein